MRLPELVAMMMAPTQYYTAPPTFVPAANNASGGSGDILAALGFSGSTLADGSESDASRDKVTLGEEETPKTALLDQYIRKRSVVSFSIPNLGPKMGGGAANFTFEIETAYRLITPVEPGMLVDSQG